MRRGTPGVHLDFGAHDGAMLNVFRATGAIAKGFGLELNSEAIKRGLPNLDSQVRLIHIKKNATLPFDDNYFDSISMIGVLEHIHDQDRIICELKRVVKAGGELTFAVPGKHLFSFLDMGNWKFLFPQLHKFYTLRRIGAVEYQRRYQSSVDGLVGDIEVEKGWHQHFSYDELIQLLSKHGLTFVDKDGYGFFHRLLINVQYFLPRGLKELLNPLIRLDSIAFHSAEIWVVVKKR